jgi:hypothetical protein
MDLKKKIYISITIFVIAAVLLVAFLIYPFAKSINKDSEDLLSQKGRLALFKKEAENTEEALSFYKSRQLDLEKIDTLFIDPGNPIEFINFLEDNARASQLEIEIDSLQSSLTSPSQIKGAKIWPSLNFQLSVNGSFPNFSRYLDKLENSPYLLEVLDLSAKKLSKEEVGLIETQSPGVNVTFSVRVYTK